MVKNTKNIKVQDNYKTKLTKKIISSGDIIIEVITPPTNKQGFIIINPSDVNNREQCFYHDVVGNNIYVKAENRVNPKAHAMNDIVQINDTSLIFNYLSQRTSTTFFVEKIGGLNVKVWGGPIMVNNKSTSVNDTELLLVDDSINYIKYDIDTGLISSSNQEITEYGIVMAEVHIASGIINDIKYRNHPFNIFDTTDPAFKGPKGDNAPNVQIQYSIDGTTSWHTVFQQGDLYLRTSTDGGETWTGAMRFIGIDGVDGADGADGKTVTSVTSSKTGDITTVVIDGTFAGSPYSFEIEDGLDGADGINGTNAPEVSIQYSIDGTTLWHTTFLAGDKYIRFSTDNGATWTSGYKFIGEDGDGSGDMLKSTYDTNNNGVVDNSEALGGQDGAYYRNTDNHTSGTTNSVYTITEKNKLAGIENNATADQTATEIKTAYESNADTNAYTDNEKTKLAGIEADAEVNTVDSVNGRTGAVSGLAEANAVVNLTTTQTIAGDKTFSGILKKTETEHSIVATSGTIDLDYSNGTYQKVTLSGTTTFTLSNPNRNFLTLKITNGGAQTITWPTVNWAGGTAPVLTATGTDIVSFYYDGTSYYGDYQVGFATV